MMRPPTILCRLERKSITPRINTGERLERYDLHAQTTRPDRAPQNIPVAKARRRLAVNQTMTQILIERNPYRLRRLMIVGDRLQGAPDACLLEEDHARLKTMISAIAAAVMSSFAANWTLPPRMYHPSRPRRRAEVSSSGDHRFQVAAEEKLSEADEEKIGDAERRHEQNDVQAPG